MASNCLPVVLPPQRQVKLQILLSYLKFSVIPLAYPSPSSAAQGGWMGPGFDQQRTSNPG